jgi:O-antigen/teichoic acid export membrane protein
MASLRKLSLASLKDYGWSKQYPQDVPMEGEAKAEVHTDILPILIPLDGNIDCWPTRVDLTAVSNSLPHSFMLDSFPIYEQPTWILPAFQGTRTTSNLKRRESEVEGYISQISVLVKNSGIYAFSSLAAPLITLLLAPFLTRSLTHNDFGALAVLTTVIALVSGVTQLGINSAFFRAYTYDYESKSDKRAVLSTTVILLLLISIPTTMLIIVAAPWLSILLLNNASYSDCVRLSALVILLQNLTIPGLAWLRAENRAVLYSVLSILNLLVVAGATILLVGVLRMGIAGSIIATGGGYAIIALCTLPIIVRHAGVHLRFDISLGLIIFGVPHVVNLLSGWVLQLSDRFLLGHFGTLSQAASYAVAYSLGGVLSALVIAPFSLAWWTLMFTIAKKDNAERTFQLIFRWFSIVLLFATFGLSIFGIAVLDLFFPTSYHSTGPIIPIIATSIMFNGVFLIVSLGISIRRKTWYSAVLITFSALVNFGLNLYLIPHYGAMGAALATLVAYFLLALITYFVNQRIYRVPFEIGLFGIALLTGIALYLGSDFLAQMQTFNIAWGIRTGALILYGGCLLLLGRLPARN